ncbi:MAG: hypothetical protein DMG83_01695 [Acidobacteria bacterium]|nr:MAG: hypothetical protein DMG83_01695 [Acidobacteriota bacterium]
MMRLLVGSMRLFLRLLFVLMTQNIHMKIARPVSLLLTVCFAFCVSIRSEAQLGHWQGWCEVGGHTDETAPNFVQASYPSCTVNVYLSGTTNHAVIYSDLQSTVLPNPFTARADASFGFYARQGVAYDVLTSGAGMPVPFKYSYVMTSGQGGIVSSPAASQTITGHTLTLSGSAPLVVESAALLTATSTQTLNNVRFADRFPGADACARIRAAIKALPGTGGTVDAQGFQGTQACGSDPFSGGATPPVHLLLGATQFNLATQWQLSAGSKISCLDPYQTTLTGPGNSSAVVMQSDTTIESCHIIGGYKAVDSGWVAASTRVTIRNNIIEGSLRGPNIDAAGNPIYWLIQGNVIRGGMNEGILFNANAQAVPDDPNCPIGSNCGYNQILDNWIYGNQKNGIDMNSGRNTIRGNHVFMNGGRGQTQGGLDQFGILLFSAAGPPSETPISHNIVSQNEVFSNNTFGIALIAAPGGTTSFNIVTDNSVRFNGTTASAGAADGIYLEAYQSGNVVNNVISNNMVVGNTRNGIYLNFPIAGPGLMSLNQIVDNQLLSNASYGFRTDGGGGGGGVFDNYVVNNVIVGNAAGDVSDLGSTRSVYRNKTSTLELLDVSTSIFGNSTPTSIFAVSMSGISSDTAGFKHKRFGSSCITPSIAGSTCASTYRWTTPFVDANYTATCSLGGTITGTPTLVGITNKAADAISVTIAGLTNARASTSEVDCIATHD